MVLHSQVDTGCPNLPGVKIGKVQFNSNRRRVSSSHDVTLTVGAYGVDAVEDALDGVNTLGGATVQGLQFQEDTQRQVKSSILAQLSNVDFSESDYVGEWLCFALLHSVSKPAQSCFVILHRDPAHGLTLFLASFHATHDDWTHTAKAT